MIGMSFKSLGAAILLVFSSSSSFVLTLHGEPQWKGIDGGKHYSGPKLSTEALRGKKLAESLNKKYASLAAGKSTICREAATILKELRGE